METIGGMILLFKTAGSMFLYVGNKKILIRKPDKTGQKYEICDR